MVAGSVLGFCQALGLITLRLPFDPLAARAFRLPWDPEAVRGLGQLENAPALRWLLKREKVAVEPPTPSPSPPSRQGGGNADSPGGGGRRREVEPNYIDDMRDRGFPMRN